MFTLLVLGTQYMLIGRLTLRFAKEKEDTQTLKQAVVETFAAVAFDPSWLDEWKYD